MPKKTKGTKRKPSRSKKKNNEEIKISFFELVKRAVRSEEFPKVVAVFLALFTVFCFISFVSFFVTWFSDYSLVENVTPGSLIKGERNIGNVCGNLGAFMAYVMLRYTFGIASFGFLIIFALIVLRIFEVRINHYAKWFASTMVIMLWLSCIFGFIVVGFDLEDMEDLSGIVGIGINQVLCSFLGTIGCALLLLAITIVIPMMLFKVRYTGLIRGVKRTPELISNMLQKAEKEDEETDLEEESIPVDTPPIPTAETPKPTGRTVNDLFKEPLHTEQQEPTPTEAEEPTIEPEKQPTYVFDVNTPIVTPKFTPEEEDEDDGIAFIVKDKSGNIISQTQETPEETETEEENEKPMEHHTIDEPYDPRLDLPRFQTPTTDILVDYDKRNEVVTKEELLQNNEKIKKTLGYYGIGITSISATPGPTVTLYEIVPAPGVRISKIKGLSDDIALSLAAIGIRIIAPIPGKGTIGIEVPNAKPQVVSMKSMINSPEFQNSKAELPIVLGKTVENEPYVTDLAKAPHLLVAGATGQGKSVGLNAIVSSLLYKKHPAELKFIFVDPKKVELSLYSDLDRHYLAKIPNGKNAVITDVNEVQDTLNSLCVLMDTRYELLKDVQCKKITEYNAKFLERKILPVDGHGYMPYIVVVIDEFADLIITAGKKIEQPICRIAQLARAVGIHLIIATQRPSVNVITGTIKANFPARMAFKTSSMIDSRTILDSPGAEQLIGRGDMLVAIDGKTTRLQCALIDTQEIESLVSDISQQDGYTGCFELPEPPEEGETGGEKMDVGPAGKIDALFEDAANSVVDSQYGSTSTLQRNFGIGYARAGKIIDQLERAGIVGPFNGSKPRAVLVKSRVELEEILARVLHKE